jgi:hypothetical protein
MTMQIEF